MVAVAPDDIGRVGEEECGILGLDLEVLGRCPEVVQDQQAILIRKVVEDVLGVLPEPVADDVQVRLLVQAEVGLEALPADALARIIGAPAASAGGDGDAVDPDQQVGRQRWKRRVAHGPGRLAGERQGLRPAVGRALNGLVGNVDCPNPVSAGQSRIEFYPPKRAEMIEQRQVVCDLAYAKPALAPV